MSEDLVLSLRHVTSGYRDGGQMCIRDSFW